MDCQENTTHNIRHEKHKIKNKTAKNLAKSGARYCLGCKDYTDHFKPQEVKLSLKKNQTVLFGDLINQDS